MIGDDEGLVGLSYGLNPTRKSEICGHSSVDQSTLNESFYYNAGMKYPSGDLVEEKSPILSDQAYKKRYTLFE